MRITFNFQARLSLSFSPLPRKIASQSGFVVVQRLPRMPILRGHPNDDPATYIGSLNLMTEECYTHFPTSPGNTFCWKKIMPKGKFSATPYFIEGIFPLLIFTLACHRHAEGSAINGNRIIIKTRGIEHYIICIAMTDK